MLILKKNIVFVIIFIFFVYADSSVKAAETDLNYFPQAAAENLQLGNLFYSQNYEEIIKQLTTSKEPLRAKEKYLLALAYRAQKQNDLSFAVFSELNKTVILLKPLVLYHLGNIKAENKEYQESNNYYLDALNAATGYPALMQDILFKIIENCKALNQFETAEKYLNTLMTEYVTDYSHYKDVFLNLPVKPDIILELAKIKIQRKQFRQAFTYISDILDNFENSDAAGSALGLLNVYKNNFQNFIDDAARFKLAKININRGRFNDGLQTLNDLVKLEAYKNNHEIQYLIGWAYYRLGEPQNNARAVAVFEKFQTEFRRSSFGPRALFYLGMIYQRQKEYEKEKEVMEFIINTFDNDFYAFAAFKEIVEYFEDKKDVVEINNTLTRMIEYFNKPSKTEYLKRSLWYAFFYAYQLKNFDNAVELLNTLAANITQTAAEKNQTNFWMYKAFVKSGNTQNTDKYLLDILKSADYESYYYWRAIDILKESGNNVSSKIAQTKIYTMERIHSEIERNAAGNDLYSILAEIKDYRGLLLVTQDIKSSSRATRMLSLLLLLINSRHTEAISYAGSASGDKDLYLPIMYPTAYYEYMIESCANINLDKALGFGIMREESRFSARAVSRAGAIGLMQIMPATGNDINKSLKIPDFDRNSLFEPKINISCGTFELKRLNNAWQAQGYDNVSSLIFSIASYNAGENAVKRWVPRFYSDLRDIDLFAELIPYRETRGYVNRVYKSYSVYKALYE